jgi:hypothetical protein
MAERLGEALLDLRTNDAGFTTGVQQAEGKAQRLGAQLDRTSGSSAKLAGEMAATGRSAAQMGVGFEQAGQRVTASAGQQRAGLQQLSFQLNDMATMFALGARPMQIFASQSGQVIQSLQMMTGGTSRLAAFLGGPWGLALTSAAVVLTPFIGKLFESEDALNAVQFASDNLGDAQSRLRSVIDTTTGSIDRQKVALIELARAQALAEGLRARRAEQALRGQLQGAAQEDEILRGPGGIPIFGGFPQGFLRRRTDSANVVNGVLNGQVRPEEATRQLSRLRQSGEIGADEEVQLSSTIANLGVEGINRQRAEAELRFYGGNATAADRQLLGVGDLVAGGARSRGSGGARGSRGARGTSQADVDARFEGDLAGVTQQILRARLQMATSADERAELAARGVEWDRREALRQIETREGLSAVQREELTAATNRLADTELEAIQFNQRLELARDAQALADERFRGEEQALQIAGELADTEAQRKDIALRLYDAQLQMERIALQTIIDMEARGEVEKAEGVLASQRLANLNANAAAGREAVGRQNETRTEGFLRGLNQTSGQINEALEGISIDALDQLNDGLADAITGARSLGDVFSRVADQIIADLLRIAIQQAIIKPLASALFGGGGGGGGGGGLGSLLGSLFGGGGGDGGLSASVEGLFSGEFAGLFAKGGTIPTGQFGIVGENGPELAFARPGGLGILSNPDSKAVMGGAGGTNISIPISIDATGADAAAIARLNSQLDRLKQELPGTIVSTVREAKDRRVLS